jgi:adenine-specific DNA-methyltransferase
MNSNKEHLAMRTPNLSDEKFAALAAMFPNAVTETLDENGVVVRAVDADVLRQEINTHVVQGREERYQFTWPDKRKSILLANQPIAAALRPCHEESVDFDATENLFIEGDNLDVLKLLRETYLNRVKMIYIEIITPRLIQFDDCQIRLSGGVQNPPRGVHFQEGVCKPLPKPQKYREPARATVAPAGFKFRSYLSNAFSANPLTAPTAISQVTSAA